MSDRKHIEYCIKLGNTFMQNKLENIEYRQNYMDEMTKTNNVSYNENFKARLRRWQ